ncbi:hypothetical protein CJU73_02250 [Pseudomonas fragi]|nr:hypothetical protein CJU73_02250 [Pseudomonas fragi]
MLLILWAGSLLNDERFGICSLWEPGLPAMQAPCSIERNKVLPSRASPLPQEFSLFDYFAFATRLSKQRECPSRLSRHPCREAHCAEPPLGLPMGRVDQKPSRRPTGRPVWMRDWRATFFLCGSRACPRCRHLVLSGGTKCCHRGQARSHKGLVFFGRSRPSSGLLVI